MFNIPEWIFAWSHASAALRYLVEPSNPRQCQLPLLLKIPVLFFGQDAELDHYFITHRHAIAPDTKVFSVDFKVCIKMVATGSRFCDKIKLYIF